MCRSYNNPFHYANCHRALINNPGGLANVSQAMARIGELPRATSSSNAWWLAGTLYVAYNVTGSNPF